MVVNWDAHLLKILTQSQCGILDCILENRSFPSKQRFESLDSLSDDLKFLVTEGFIRHKPNPLEIEGLDEESRNQTSDGFELTVLLKAHLKPNKKPHVNLLTGSKLPTYTQPELLYSATDAEIKVLIDNRPGQTQFRSSLLDWYGCCIVTGCCIQDILEAAHIQPYDEGQIQDPDNGLLLRADIHKLFDANLLGFELITRHEIRIVLDSSLLDTPYNEYNGNEYGFGLDRHPKHEYLKDRYKNFLSVAKLT